MRPSVSVSVSVVGLTGPIVAVQFALLYMFCSLVKCLWYSALMRRALNPIYSYVYLRQQKESVRSHSAWTVSAMMALADSFTANKLFLSHSSAVSCHCIGLKYRPTNIPTTECDAVLTSREKDSLTRLRIMITCWHGHFLPPGKSLDFRMP